MNLKSLITIGALVTLLGMVGAKSAHALNKSLSLLKPQQAKNL